MGSGASATSAPGTLPTHDWPQDGFSWEDLRCGEGTFALDSAGWKQMSTSSRDSVTLTIHSRRLGDGRCFEYLSRGTLQVPCDTWFALNTDLEYRAKWDKACASLEEVSAAADTQEYGSEEVARTLKTRLLHWVAKYPWPVGHQDYVLEQSIHTFEDKPPCRICCIQNRSLPAAEADKIRPCTAGATRVVGYRSHTALWSDVERRTTNFAMLFFDEASSASMGASMAIVTKVPLELTTMVTFATSKYPQERSAEILRHFGTEVPVVTRDAPEHGDVEAASAKATFPPSAEKEAPAMAEAAEVAPEPSTPEAKSATAVALVELPTATVEATVAKAKADDATSRNDTKAAAVDAVSNVTVALMNGEVVKIEMGTGGRVGALVARFAELRPPPRGVRYQVLDNGTLLCDGDSLDCSTLTAVLTTKPIPVKVLWHAPSQGGLVSDDALRLTFPENGTARGIHPLPASDLISWSVRVDHDYESGLSVGVCTRELRHAVVAYAGYESGSWICEHRGKETKAWIEKKTSLSLESVPTIGKGSVVEVIVDMVEHTVGVRSDGEDWLPFPAIRDLPRETELFAVVSCTAGGEIFSLE